jgi:hypothetical protein
MRRAVERCEECTDENRMYNRILSSCSNWGVGLGFSERPSQPDHGRTRLLPAGTALHARPRPEVARQALREAHAIRPTTFRVATTEKGGLAWVIEGAVMKAIKEGPEELHLAYSAHHGSCFVQFDRSCSEGLRRQFRSR